MTSPVDNIKEYNELYHSFTEAYINVHSLTRDFYPQAKRFVEQTEPELSALLEKLSLQQNSDGGVFAYQKLVQYLNHFDDFTISANKLFADLRIVLHKCDEFMTRLLDMKMSVSSEGKDEAPESYTELTPELNTLVASLKQISGRADKLEEKIKHLENDWKMTRENLQ